METKGPERAREKRTNTHTIPYSMLLSFLRLHCLSKTLHEETKSARERECDRKKETKREREQVRDGERKRKHKRERKRKRERDRERESN